MINILICDDNIFYAKMLMDILNNEKIKVCNISINGEELLNILDRRNDIDLILLDMQLPICDGKKILETLEEKDKEKYKNSIIVISGYADLIAIARKSSLVCAYINKANSFSDITRKINAIVESKIYEKKEREIENNIIKQVEYLHYNRTYKGTKYLQQSIKIIIKNDDMDLSNLKKDVYSKIAIRNNTSVSNIKNNIEKATEQMYYECDHNILKKYFGFEEDMKPTVKMVIFTIASKVKKDKK